MPPVDSLIQDAIEAEKAIAFRLDSVNDCLGFASRVAIQMTGRDPVTHIRGRYGSGSGARRVMVIEGWKNLGDVAASCYPEISLSEARTGDWAFVDDPCHAIGVVRGDAVYIKEFAGVAVYPLTAASRAFRVT